MKRFLKKMHGRDITEQHRVATPLELFFDLVFVIAIAAAASGLHHALAEHHISAGLINFGVAFFAIWWGWMNYTWFASAFDNDDTIYRILTMFQMLGAIVMAVGIPDLFTASQDMFIVVVGYAIMRIAMVLQWLRAANHNPNYRAVCLRNAIGIAVVQALWIIRYFTVPATSEIALLSIGVLILCELSVALFAGRTPWHPHHIAERYGLLVIIVLGEGLLGVANTIRNVLALEDGMLQIFTIGMGVIALTFAMWWLYFNQPYAHCLEREIDHQHRKRTTKTSAFFAYIHYFVFASLAALGVGISLLADAFQPVVEGSHVVTMAFAIRTLSIAVTVYLICIALLRIVMMGANSRTLAGLGLVFVSPVLCVLSVEMGLPVIYAVWLSIISPVLMILLYGKTETHH